MNPQQQQFYSLIANTIQQISSRPYESANYDRLARQWYNLRFLREAWRLQVLGRHFVEPVPVRQHSRRPRVLENSKQSVIRSSSAEDVAVQVSQQNGKKRVQFASPLIEEKPTKTTSIFNDIVKETENNTLQEDASAQNHIPSDTLPRDGRVAAPPVQRDTSSSRSISNLSSRAALSAAEKRLQTLPSSRGRSLVVPSSSRPQSSVGIQTEPAPAHHHRDALLIADQKKRVSSLESEVLQQALLIDSLRREVNMLSDSLKRERRKTNSSEQKVRSDNVSLT